MTNIEGQPPLTPQDRQLYEAEYKHAVDLFQRALNEYSTADEVHKKDAFREVMDRTLMALNDVARGLKRQDLLKQNSQIEQDYITYQSTQDNTDKSQLLKDLDQANKSIR